MEKGDVYFVDLKNQQESIQKGIRPCIIIQNNLANQFSPNVIIVPLTTSLKREDLPVHVKITTGDSKKSYYQEIALCECILTVSKSQIKKYIKSLNKKQMREIEIALLISLGII